MSKITAIILALALLGATPVFANDSCCKGGKNNFSGKNFAEKKINRLKEKLSLNDAQVTQVQSILDAKKEKMEAIHKETQDQISAILTPEQKEKFEAMKKKNEEKHNKHKGHDEE